jgi:tetratricopeptide (TPR) repeat protein
LSPYNLSNRLAGTGRRAEAATKIQEAIEVYEQLAKADPKTFEQQLARSLANLGRWLQESGDPVQSIEPILKARAILEKHHRTDLVELTLVHVA